MLLWLMATRFPMTMDAAAIPAMRIPQSRATSKNPVKRTRITTAKAAALLATDKNPTTGVGPPS